MIDSESRSMSCPPRPHPRAPGTTVGGPIRRSRSLGPGPCVATPLVRKYGGSSLSTTDKVRAVAQQLVKAAAGGRPLVVVVSAMGDTTTRLIDDALALDAAPSRRELDVLVSSGERISMALLAMAIENEGRAAVSLTGAQCGIATDGEHAQAAIRHVSPRRVLRELAAGRIVVAAGFQGAGPNGDVTTLGRGGSDTTAVALAAALGSESCEIYSDVPGVYSADPRVVADPRHLRRIEYRSMIEYAAQGARVLHPDCVDLARRHGVTIRARAAFGGAAETVICADGALEFSGPSGPGLPVAGVTARGQRVRLVGPARSGRRIEGALRELGGCAHTLRASRGGVLDVLLDLQDRADGEDYLERLRSRLGDLVEVRTGLSSVSVIADPGARARLGRRAAAALEAAGISPLGTYERARSWSCAVPEDARERATRVLHEALVEVRFRACVERVGA